MEIINNGEMLHEKSAIRNFNEDESFKAWLFLVLFK